MSTGIVAKSLGEAGRARRRAKHAVFEPSSLDRQILAAASSKLGSGRPSFDQVIGALRASVEELVPAGRIFWLGALEGRPIFGSIVSGVGVVADARGVLIVRVGADQTPSVIGRLVG